MSQSNLDSLNGFFKEVYGWKSKKRESNAKAFIDGLDDPEYSVEAEEDESPLAKLIPDRCVLLDKVKKANNVTNSKFVDATKKLVKETIEKMEKEQSRFYIPVILGSEQGVEFEDDSNVKAFVEGLDDE